MKVRAFAVLLVAASITLLSACAGGQTVAENGRLKYSPIEENGEVVAYKVAGLGDYSLTTLTIPSEYGGKPVVAIADAAFLGAKDLTKIVVADSVEKIGDLAFARCENLRTIEIPSSVNEIGGLAFEGCRSLKYNVFSNGYYLGDANEKYLFLISEIDKKPSIFTVNENTEYIYDTAFSDGKIRSVDIPEKVRYVSPTAFSYCSELIGITCSENNAFYKAENNCLIDKENRLVVAANGAEIPDVRIIGKAAFSCRTKMTGEVLTLPEGVEKVEYGAFAYSKFKGVRFPSTVSEIGENLFYPDSGSIESLTVDESNAGYRSEGNAVIKNDGNVLVVGCKRTVVADTVKEIGRYSFDYCSDLSELTLNEGVKKIDSYAFFNCKDLKTLVIPYSLVDISEKAFGGNSAATVTILENVFVNAYDVNENLIVNSGNEGFSVATFYYLREEKPTDGGNYYHYVNGERTIWQG